ncbi:MAG: methylated-DNA--[protein]-cysteine S-methyltransferase [Calditrichaceae bacterium]
MSSHYNLIEKAILYLDDHFREQPGLEELSAGLGVSSFHLQKVFKQWVGISPKRFLQFLTIDHARKVLADSRSVLDAAYDSGLSGPGRLHDLFISIDAVTPGEYKIKGAGLKINYGFHESPFGCCLIAVTGRGICGLSFHDESGRKDGLETLRKNWPDAELIENSETTSDYYHKIFLHNADPVSLKLFVKGTNFQLKVWEALLKIPAGALASYDDIARNIGHPSSSRAVGNAVGSNPVSFIIPCHRVIHKMGRIGNYHWGAARKKAILGWEAAMHSDVTAPV